MKSIIFNLDNDSTKIISAKIVSFFFGGEMGFGLFVTKMSPSKLFGARPYLNIAGPKEVADFT